MQSEERKSVEKELWRLALPAMLQGLLFTVVFVVDTLMVARLGAASIAAVGAAGPVIWSISSLLFAFSRATTALVAKGTGAKNIEEARMASGQSLAIAVLLGLVTALAFVFGRFYIMAPFGLEAEVLPLAAKYLAIVGGALLFSLPGHIFAVTFQAAGDTKTPLIVSAIGNLVNIVGDYVLIFGIWGFPALGVVGAAIATAACRVVEATLMGIMLWRKEVCPHRRHIFALHMPTLRSLLYLGTPATAEAASFHFGYLLFSCLVSWLGTVALAAHRICLSIEALAFMPASGLAVAAATHTGQRLGAKREDLAEYGIKHVRVRVCQFMAIVAFVLLAFPHFFVSFYTSKSDVAIQSALCLRIGAFELIPLGIAMALTGALQGAGDTKSPFVITTLGIWLVRVPLTALFGLHWGFGLPGVWVATAIDWLIRAMLIDRAIKGGRWKMIFADKEPSVAASAVGDVT